MKKAIGIALGGILGFLLIGFWNQETWQGERRLAEAEVLCQMLQKEVTGPKISVQGTEVGGLRRSEVRAVLKEAAHTVLEQKIQLNGRKKSYIYTLKQLGVVQDTEGLLEEVWSVGRKGTAEERIQAIREPVDFSMGYFIDKELLRERIREIGREEGAWLDRERTEQMLLAQMGRLTGGQIKLPRQEIISAAQLSDSEIMQEILGAYQTSYDPSQTGRSINLTIAAGKINGTVLMPGEEFSYIEAVGPVTAKAGYQEGNMLLGGKYIPGIGGGICQISTTLYVAVLKSELQILERHNHGFPASYAVPGMDATIASEAGIDFRFKNTSQFPIYIEAWAEGGQAEVCIYGTDQRPSHRQIYFRTERVSYDEKAEPIIWEDASRPAGYREIIVPGYQGGQIDTYKVVMEKGKRTEEWISSSYYKSSADQICIGTGEK